ncbi:MAG: DNA-directed DNA polymerase II small subunit [Candidatus Verstraetearchaeota archaeon]|nr:DNA-directed DNA polymerase II small subunit [Candidatus Verstraetearchaeota archaeon]
MAGNMRAAVEMVLHSGFQLSPDAFEYLASKRDPDRLVEAALKSIKDAGSFPLVLDRSYFEALEHTPKTRDRLHCGCISAPRSEPNPETKAIADAGGLLPGVAGSRALAVNLAAPRYEQQTAPSQGPAFFEGDGVRLISGLERMTIKGKASDFRDYFRDRLESLSSILRSRADVSGATTASQVPDGLKWHKVKFIGMVNSKKEFRDGTVVVELEDEEGLVKVTFRGDEAIKKKAARLLVDEVVCVLGATRNGSSVIAEDVIWPDIPYLSRTPAPSSDHAYAVLTSDVHIGSKTFLRDDFERFLGWLRGETDEPRLNEIANKTKYLVIAGDLVDGVGIYPNQEEELEVADLYDQYRIAAEYLSTLPDRIKIIIIPGNHDACRPTLPTPPIYSDYAAPLYSMRNVLMLGDPSFVNLSGATFLLTHGRSLDDVIPFLPDCNFREPQRAMVELLKSRHIAPIYGEKTPLAPEPKDRLVIDPVPDIFHAGHVHVEGVAEYRGVLVVNSGTWQSQTKYQLSAGIAPKPSVVPVVDLTTMKTYELNFS